MYGCTEGYTVTLKGRMFHILPDDIYKYTFDTRKLFTLMVIIFDETFHHISQEGFKQHNGYLIFQEALKHFERHEARDIIFHHQALLAFDLKLPVKSNYVEMDTLFINVEELNEHATATTSTMLTHFRYDPRPGVPFRIQTMILMESTYPMIYKSLCEMNPMDDFPRHHALALRGITELCRRFGLGTCPHSDTDCKYLHRGKAGSMLKLTDTHPPPKPLVVQSGPPKTTYPFHIAQRHRASLGPMTGTVSKHNPTGISHKQIR
jgi:hypothetical protein